jgi:hypothetical protein
MISPPKKFRIEFNAGTKLFEEFKMFIGNKCNDQVLNAALYMREATESGSPPLNWKVWLVRPTAPGFKKSDDYLINTEESYTRWINVVIQLGKESTEAGLEITMDNPADAVRQAQAEAELQDHVLARQAARDANNDGTTLGPRVLPTDFDILNVYINKIFSTHQPNKKYNRKFPVFIDQTNDKRYIPLSPSMIQQWARALVSH